MSKRNNNPSDKKAKTHGHDAGMGAKNMGREDFEGEGFDPEGFDTESFDPTFDRESRSGSKSVEF